MSEYKVLLRRSELGVCRRCKKDPKKEVFSGRFNEHGTQMTSSNGWWLRIVHNYDIYKDWEQLPDAVGDLKCKECCELEMEEMKELLDFL